ncbi:MAG TPA: helix-turn-helix domain-containing protein, partial [Spirochaetota bacterium]|nr:helix-turn-helix domain-containing protein [Spirochaetota bacterium]
SGDRERAVLRMKLMQAYYKTGNMEQCEKAGLEALSLLGDSFPASRPGVPASIAFEIALNLIPGAFATGPSDGETAAGTRSMIMECYYWLYWAFLFGDNSRRLLVVLKFENRTRRWAPVSRERAMSCCFYGTLWYAAGRFAVSGRYLRKAASMCEALNDRWGAAQVLMLSGHLGLFSGDFHQCIEQCTAARSMYEEMGDGIETLKCVFLMYMSWYFLGDFRRAMECWNVPGSSCGTGEDTLRNGWGFPALISADNGHYSEAEEYLRESAVVHETMEIRFPLFTTCCAFSYLYGETGDAVKGRQWLERAEDLDRRHGFSGLFMNFLEVCRLRILFAEYDQRRMSMNNGEKRRSLKKLHRACRRALRRTKKWKSHYGTALRSMAQYYVRTGKNDKAEEHFRKSIAFNESIHRKYETARCRLEYGVFLREKKGDMFNAVVHIDSARSGFREIGADLWEQRAARFLGVQGPAAMGEDILNQLERLKCAADFDEMLRLNKSADEMIRHAVERATALVKGDRCYLFLVDEATKSLTLKHSHVTGDDVPDVYPIETASGVFKNGTCMIVKDTELSIADPRDKGIPAGGARSVVCVPVMRGMKIMGACYFDSIQGPGRFSEQDAEFLGMYISRAAVCVENRIMRDSIRNLKRPAGARGESYPADFPTLIREYLDSNFRDDCSRERLGKEFSRNPDYIFKKFRKHFGISVYEYVNERRVWEAADLLGKGGNRIIDVAFMVGFESLRTFNREFIKITGVTPSQYRKNLYDEEN